MSKMPKLPLAFLQLPEMVAYQNIARTLLRLDSKTKLNSVSIREDEVVPENSDTIFGYRHITIHLGSASAKHAEALSKALTKLTQKTAVRASDDSNSIWFYGTLEQLAELNPVLLERTAKRFTEKRSDVYRGH